MVITQIGANGRLARIHVDLDSCFAAELAPIPLRPTVDLSVQDWGDPCRARSVTSWTVQVWREGWGGLIQLLIFFEENIANAPCISLAIFPALSRNVSQVRVNIIHSAIPMYRGLFLAFSQLMLILVFS